MTNASRPTISIVIPVLNEIATLQTVLATAKTGKNIEIIVVDGGSTDGTLEVLKGIRVLESDRGRANQMNAGAAIATGDILLFLHGDTRLPAKYETWVRHLLTQPGVVAGAFELKIDANLTSLRFIETLVKCRSRFLQMPYGDQAIFLKASTFQEIGGFPAMPIMEDFELVRQLQKRGRIAIAPVAVTTSGRRWLKLGVCKTTLINQLVILAYYLGISPKRIASWYRGARRNAAPKNSELF